MNTLVQTLFNGMALGSVYALVALGFCLVFKASGAVNFAHGSLLLLGGYLVAVLHEPLGFAGALAVAALGTAVAAALEALVLRRVAKANGPAVPTILTIGIDILLLTELARRIGGDVLGTGDPWGADVLTVGGITVAQARVYSLLAAVLLVGAFLTAFRWTGWGLSMRAYSSDAEAAALMGVRGDRLRIVPGFSQVRWPRWPRCSWRRSPARASTGPRVRSPSPPSPQLCWADSGRSAVRSWAACSSAWRRRWRPDTNSS